MFENEWVRFGLSGTLIAAYHLAERFARRGHPAPPRLPQPVWVGPLIFVSLLAFYLLIRPTGGPLMGGLGNLAGIALVAVTLFLRPQGVVRYPHLARRCLFYLGLPIAVGVPWGLLVLTLPACASSVYLCVRTERAAARDASAAEAARAAGDTDVAAHRTPYRLVPGIW